MYGKVSGLVPDGQTSAPSHIIPKTLTAFGFGWKPNSNPPFAPFSSGSLILPVTLMCSIPSLSSSSSSPSLSLSLAAECVDESVLLLSHPGSLAGGPVIEDDGVSMFGCGRAGGMVWQEGVLLYVEVGVTGRGGISSGWGGWEERAVVLRVWARSTMSAGLVLMGSGCLRVGVFGFESFLAELLWGRDGGWDGGDGSRGTGGVESDWEQSTSGLISILFSGSELSFEWFSGCWMDVSFVIGVFHPVFHGVPAIWQQSG